MAHHKLIDWTLHGPEIITLYVTNRLSVREVISEIKRRHGVTYHSGTLTNFLGRQGVSRTASEAHSIIHKKRQKICESCNEKYIAKSYRQRWCIECTGTDEHTGVLRRMKKRLHAYGVGAPALQSMLDSQNYSCKICKEKFPDGFSSDRRKTLYVDHDHITGKVRGLVCPRCNLGLSYVDKPGWLESAAVYIEEAKIMPDLKTLHHRRHPIKVA